MVFGKTSPAQASRIAAMWRSRQVGLFPRRYSVEDGAAVVGQVSLGNWAERGRIELAGRELAIRRQGFWNAKYSLTDAGEPVVTALRSGAFGRGFYFARGDDEYHLDRGPFFARSFELTRKGQPLGTIRATGLFPRNAQIQLDDALAPELRLFAFWLVAHAWHRAVQAAVAVVLIAMITATR
jgi:hypothetical protein